MKRNKWVIITFNTFYHEITNFWIYNNTGTEIPNYSLAEYKIFHQVITLYFNK